MATEHTGTEYIGSEQQGGHWLSFVATPHTPPLPHHTPSATTTVYP